MKGENLQPRIFYLAKFHSEVEGKIQSFLDKNLKEFIPTKPAAILFLGIYPKNMKALIWKDRCTPIFIAALFTIARIWKEVRCPSIDEWIKMWYICKKERNLAICNNMDRSSENYAKWNKSEKDKTIWFHLYVDSKKQNKWTHETKTDS